MVFKMAEVPFEKLKGEERQWRISDAAETLKRYAALKRKENASLLKAARKELEKQIEDSKKALQKTS